MATTTTTKPQLLYTLAILEKYSQTQSAINKTMNQKAPVLAYRSCSKMLQESLLLGSTKFGLNFIF